jgi:hypothetical protein
LELPIALMATCSGALLKTLDLRSLFIVITMLLQKKKGVKPGGIALSRRQAI